MSELNLENSLKKLEEISKYLESPDIPLDEAMKNFEEGLNIIKKCNKMLNDAESKIINMTDNPQTDDGIENDKNKAE